MRRPDRSAPVWGIGVLLLAMLLTACGGGETRSDEATPEADTLDARLGRYADTLRGEADWLWENMNYARGHSVPDPARCTAPDFGHQPVTVDAETRKTDDTVGLLADRLDYVALLLGQAQAVWAEYCTKIAGSSSTASLLESRLRPAYASLTVVTNTLALRASSAAS